MSNFYADFINKVLQNEIYFYKKVNFCILRNKIYTAYLERYAVHICAFV